MCGFSAAHIREPEARNRDLILEPAEPRSCDRVITDRLGIENDTVMVVCTIRWESAARDESAHY